MMPGPARNYRTATQMIHAGTICLSYGEIRETIHPAPGICLSDRRTC